MDLNALLTQLIFIFLLILANGFFAGAEIAIIAVRRSRVKQLMEQGDRRARSVHLLHEDMERFLATTQIGVTVVSSLAAAVGGVAAIEVIKPFISEHLSPPLQRISETLAVGVVVVTISYLSLIVGELVPKSLALKYPERIALAIAGPIHRLSTVAGFFIRILTLSSRGLLKLFGGQMPSERAFVSEEEIKLLVREGRERGIFDQTEQDLIHSVFEFTDISVKEVMVARPKMHVIQADMPVDEILQYMARHKFSRYPVCRKGINDIIGILYYKNLLDRIAKKESININELMHPVYFIPETMKVSHLLKELQRRRLQMAIVVNEYGSVEGLVTMEDLIEEIVGEIQNEVDRGERPVERLKDGSLVVDASLSVRDLHADYGLPIPESSDYETLAGFVMAQLQNMPRGGEIIQFDNYKFTIVDMDDRRIAKVKAEKLPKIFEQVPAKNNPS